MAKIEYFTGINKIPFEGSESNNPFAFKYYNPVSESVQFRQHLNTLLNFFNDFGSQRPYRL